MMPPAMHQQQAQIARMGDGAGAASAAGAPFYQTPQYQSHLQQLGKLPRPAQQRFYSSKILILSRIEQEYDADIMDEQQGHGQEGEDGPGPYPGVAYATHAAAQQQQMTPTATTAPGQQHGMSMANMLDPAMDWDPFGLSASMAFPSSFSFDTSNMR